MTKADPQSLSRDDLALTAAFLIALAAWRAVHRRGAGPDSIHVWHGCTDQGVVLPDLFMSGHGASLGAPVFADGNLGGCLLTIV